jgi:tRNA A-37 threonylcarbamoyl transferase component Bud32/DNA-binding transcriptional MerR regulator
MSKYEFSPVIRPGFPDFNDLNWELSLNEWPKDAIRVEEIQHGISRHPVVFVNYSGTLYAIKELPEHVAQKEYELLSQIEERNLSCVKPVGFAAINRNSVKSSVLFTRYLETSVPYRLLFISKAMDRYQMHLLDAISGLLVQLHSNGFYWGDCSLSNVLFRRDAGTLQAYLVDAETAEFHLPPLSPMLRYQDLEIMQENVLGELSDLQINENLSYNYPIQETGPYIQQRYRSLWEEITREEVFNENELFRIQERIRVLNSLGFSVKDIELKKENHGSSLKLRIFVSDRYFHRNQLMELTGLFAEDRQAQQIMNEIYELKANISQTNNPNISLEAVSFHWLEQVYKPVIEKLKPILKKDPIPKDSADPIELYCQILEHKWYLSERAQHDVGHQAAVEDFLLRFS